MIINISRYKSRLCRRKSFNLYHRQLTAPRKSMNLVDGSAFHAGVARGLATKQWDHNPLASTEIPCECAHCAAEQNFNKEKEGLVMLPELEFQLQDHQDMIDVMINCYGEAFKDQGIQVIQPECEFDVKIPHTYHHCIWLHHIDNGVEKWSPPTPEAILEGRISSPHRRWLDTRHVSDAGISCLCWQPHRFVGKTDAVVVWNGLIWLLEHKTTSISGEQFWAQWRLDIQPTGYIYGIKKALNVPVGGFILNAIIKPSEAQVAAWNKKRKYGEPKEPKDYIKYEREAFLRSEEDLKRFEDELILTCNEWERDILAGTFPLAPFPGVCNQYNRICDYHSMCVGHDQQGDMDALVSKDSDYVDIKVEALAVK